MLITVIITALIARRMDNQRVVILYAVLVALIFSMLHASTSIHSTGGAFMLNLALGIPLNVAVGLVVFRLSKRRKIKDSSSNTKDNARKG